MVCGRLFVIAIFVLCLVSMTESRPKHCIIETNQGLFEKGVCINWGHIPACSAERHIDPYNSYCWNPAD
uniref:Uncharacterized protein n=1 Tax=Acrobeloides nanus TaxID=290746 RepID=A0A914E1A2_9BILA